MFYLPSDLQRFEEEYRTISGKSDSLCQAFLTRRYNDPPAQEYARHGFSRRLRTLVRCIENTFEILPPDQVGLPTSEKLSDAIINLQAFIFNLSGCVDNRTETKY